MTEDRHTAPVLAEAIEKLIESFIETRFNLTDSSRSLYRKTLILFFRWVSLEGYDFRSLDPSVLGKYYDFLQKSEKSSLTISAYITSLRLFFRWAESEKLFPVSGNIAGEIHNPKRKPRFRKEPLTQEQGRNLLRYAEKHCSPRDFSIINLLLRTGLRTVEVVRADVGDIQFKRGQRVLLVQGKGRREKDNFVILTDKTFFPMEAYLKSVGYPTTGPLFPSESFRNMGGRLSTRTVSRIAKDCLKAVGLDGPEYSAHSLRHTAGVNILRASGWNIEKTQRAMRHSNPSTTQWYMSTIVEEERLSDSGEKLLDDVF